MATYLKSWIEPIAVMTGILTVMTGMLWLSAHGNRIERQANAQTSLSQTDPDYCEGIACTEETDTCCDESVR